MSAVKPVTSIFGGFPNSAEAIAACQDPQQTWYLLRANLDHQLAMRPPQMMTFKATLGLRKHEKKLQKLVQQGWQIQARIPEKFWRVVFHTLTRPQVSSEEMAFLGWK